MSGVLPSPFELWSGSVLSCGPKETTPELLGVILSVSFGILPHSTRQNTNTATMTTARTAVNVAVNLLFMSIIIHGVYQPSILLRLDSPTVTMT